MARAATLAGEHLCDDREGDRVTARRLLAALDHGTASGCQAKDATVRAPLALDCPETGL